MNAIEQFIKAYYTNKEEQLLQNLTMSEEAYWANVWKPSRMSDAQFDHFWLAFKIPLPATFKQFYQHYFSFEPHLQWPGYTFGGSQKINPLNGLLHFVEKGRQLQILKMGLLPFGMHLEEWYICLDLIQDAENPPIVLFEKAKADNKKKAISQRNWFSDFETFLGCMANLLATGDDSNFDAIDPENNFRTAYDSWKE